MINPSKKATIAIYSIGAVISFSSSYYLTGKAFDHYDIGKDHTVNTVIVRTVPIEKVIIKNNTPTTTTVDTVETYNPGQDSSADTGTTPTGIPGEENDNTTGNGGNQQQNNSDNTGGNNQKRNTNGHNYPEENVNTPQRHNSPNTPDKNTSDRGNSRGNNRRNPPPAQQGNTPRNNGNSPSPTNQGNNTQGNATQGNSGGSTSDNNSGVGEQLFPNIPLPNPNTENNGNTAGENGI